jgi:predicted phosphodiesterase
MKIQLASDLHLEYVRRDFPGERLIYPAPDSNLLVLAGDISWNADAIDLFRDWPVPVVYVAGNHEAYGYRWPEVIEGLRRASAGTQITVLERNVLEIGDVRFLGCTLWTDYRLRKHLSQEAAMLEAGRCLNDHQRIRNSDGSTFSPQDALQEHELSRAWLESELAKPYAGKTVVVTHHAPHPGSEHPRYAGDALTPAFVSDLLELVVKADLWIHGHTHDGYDYRVGGCRVVANPAGYMANRSTAGSAVRLTFENQMFDRSYVIDVDE